MKIRANKYKKAIKAACGGKKSVKASYGRWGKFYGLNDVEFTVPNDTDDPTIYYNGNYYNYYTIEDTLWDYYKDECAENGVSPDENEFEKWVADNSYYVYDLLDEIQPKSEPGRGVYCENTNTLRKSIKSSRQRRAVKASSTYKYAVWVLDGDDNTWKCWGGKDSTDLGMSEDEFLDSINHQTYPNPEYNVDNNYVDVMVIDGDKTPADYGQTENVKEYGEIAESTRRAVKAAEETGTVTLDDMNTDVIPVVDFGTYGGSLSYALEDVFVADYLEVDNLDPENEDEAGALELINEGYDGTQEFFDQVLGLAPLYIQDAFDQYGIPAKVVSGSCKWNHPREYNYYDDTIEFSMTIDTDWVASKFAELSANEPKFADYLKDNYSSRSGFISYMPNEVEGYNDLLDPNSSDYWKVVSAIVMFMVNDDPSIRNDVTDDMIEYLRSNSDYASLSSYGIY